MREIVRAVLADEGVADYEISLAFVDNPTIHTLNKRYLDHDEPTDVLSFPLSAPGSRKLSGELLPVGILPGPCLPQSSVSWPPQTTAVQAQQKYTINNNSTND